MQKCYRLDHRTQDKLDNIIRMKGLPRKCQNILQVRHFSQDPLTHSGACRSVEMRPTLGGEIVMQTHSRNFGVVCNKKRKMTVRRGCTN
jgi:hypothetical protein